MARKKSGGFGKVLEFIGLVDDEEPRETYDDEYESGNYGRPQPYTPQRPQRTQEQPRQEVSRRYSSSYEPTRTPRMNRTASSTGSSSRFDSRSSQSATQRRSSYNDRSDSRTAARYDYTPRTASRFDDASTFFADEAPQPQQRSSRASTAPRQKTVMFALHNLEDCCDVIDNLILNNTVVLTMDDLDAKLMQRAVDTLSGAVFALHATIRKASDRTYLIAPMTVEVNETYDTDDRFL